MTAGLKSGAGGTSPTETFSFAGTLDKVTLSGYLENSSLPLILFGFSSDTPFSTVSISDPSYALAVDNLTFVNGPANSNPVPELSVLAVLGFGLLALTGFRRYSQTQK